MAELLEELARIEGEINALRAEAREFIATYPVTDAALPATLAEGRDGRDRYVLVLPDGSRYWDLPGRPFVTSGFIHRPAADRACGRLPGCRVLDVRTGQIVTTQRPVLTTAEPGDGPSCR